MKRILLALACAAVCIAQEGSIVNPTIGPAPTAHQRLIYYDASANVEYVCVARSNQRERSVTVTAASNANPAVLTATAHGFADFATMGATISPVIRISGATGNWTPINGVWKATVTSADAFSIPVNSAAFGALTGTLVVSTTSPRVTDAVWSIQRMFYDGSDNLVSIGWASSPGGAGASMAPAGATAMDKACGSRTSYSYQ